MNTERSRFINQEWIRDPEGELLTKPPPVGTRAPNGIIWGHSINDFFWIRRIPGVNVMTIWSRTMIQEYGENYMRVVHPYEPPPRPLLPWPILKISRAPSDLSDENLTEVSKEQVNDNTSVDNTAESNSVVVGSQEVNPKDASPEKLTGKVIFASLPKFEEFIPKEFFPDILLVNDPDRLTEPHSYSSVSSTQHLPQSVDPIPVRYKRMWPTFPRDVNLWDKASSKTSTPETLAKINPPQFNIAHLNLSSAPVIGIGHHSTVYRSALRLPPPLSTKSPTEEVIVAAKTAFNNSEARELLLNEGEIYNACPEHLMEDWSGLNLVSPIVHPVPVGAVVPKFYGYYVPDREYAEAEKARKKKEKHLKRKAKTDDNKKCKEDDPPRNIEPGENASKGTDTTATEVIAMKSPENRTDAGEETERDNSDGEDSENSGDGDEIDSEIDWKRRSPILLLEECGSPVEPKKFSIDDRSTCYSLLLRLQHAQFVHNSFYTRNILTQPGPLTSPPDQRSPATPSFRIIDFGRSNYWERFLKNELDKCYEFRNTGSPGIRVAEGPLTEQEYKDERDKETRLAELRLRKTKNIAAEWIDLTGYDVRKAQDELKIPNFDF